MTDLHIHSIFSDGILTIEEIAELCRKKGIRTISITDHDDIRSIKYIKKITLPKDVTFIPGVEMSTESHYLGKKTKIHLLGYGFDENNPELINTFKDLHKRRGEDNKTFIDELIKRYEFLSKEQFTDFDYGKYGWIKKLILLQLKDKIQEEQQKILTTYLNEHKPVYHQYNQQAEDAIRVIKNAGGYVIFAHPPITKLTPIELEQMIIHLKEYGLDGIETYHSLSSQDDMSLCHSIAVRNQLLESVGSDYHLDDDFHIEIGTGVNGNLQKDDIPLVKKLISEGKIIK